jgi:NAD(P)-dependent dehydrogenase (short-subunit alcohol dehydrogenase family)
MASGGGEPLSSLAPLVVDQPAAAGPGDVADALDDVFAAVRDAVLHGRPVTVLVRDVDLLGQGTATDAAVANALLGMVRALALEGARHGWRVNAVATGSERPPRELLALLPGAELSGQLLRTTGAGLGRVPV